MIDPQTTRAAHLLDLGRHVEARTLVVSLLAERPDDRDLLGMLAQAHLGADDLPAALDTGNRLVGVSPDDEWGHRICSVVLDRMGRPDEAARAAQAAVRLAPLEWRTHYQLASALADVRGQLWPARQAALRAVELAPGEAKTHFMLGVVEQRRSDVDAARVAYGRALALDPSHALAHNNLTVLAGGRHLGRAARGYATSLRLDPGNELVLQNVDGLAVVFVRRLYYAALVALVIGLVCSAPAGRDAPTPAGVGVGVVLLLALVGYPALLGRAIPTGVRRHVLSRTLRQAYPAANLLLAAAMVGLALVVCWVPGGAVVGLASLQPIGLLNVAVFVWSRARRA